MNVIDPCKPEENGIEKCQNHGTCIREGINGHKCDCTSTDFNGTSCEIGIILNRKPKYF